MARIALVQGGVAAKVIEAEPGFTVPGYTSVEDAGVAVGDLWDGTRFTRPVLPQQEPEE